MAARRCAIAFVLAGLVSLAAPAVPAPAAPSIGRLGGVDRYDTAAAISRATFAAGVPVTYVATGEAFSDALAAGPAAARDRGPVLLTQRTQLPGPTATELRRLAPARIVVVGGTASVSDAVVSQLQSFTSGPVDRVAGGDRAGTAAAIAASFRPGVAAFVANGSGFADALAGGPAAARAGGPVLLTARDALPAPTVDALRRLAPPTIVVLGGPAAVSDAVVAQLRGLAPNVGRSSGTDRYDTSVAVSVNAFAPGVPRVFLATGTSFPDALAGGPLAGLAPGPILLVSPSCIPPRVNAEIDRLNPQQIIVLGGSAAIGPSVMSRTTCTSGPPVPAVTPAVAPAFDDDAPDPDVVSFGGTYYAYTTGTTWGNRIGVLVSSAPDRGWHTTTGKPYGSTALPSFPAWQTRDTQTSPGVFFWAGRYVMFYDAIDRASGKYCITVATSSSPTGPFTDASAGPLICQVDLGGSIDPHPFVDGDGRTWLHWKNNDGSSAAVSSVWAAPLAAGGDALADSPQLVMSKDSANHPWQNTVDDPQMVLVNGTHLLFFSGGDWESDRYAVGYAICSSVAGPCSQPQADPILRSYPGVAGPGGGTVVQDPGGQWWLSYQGWDPSCTNYGCGGKRRLYVAPLTFR